MAKCTDELSLRFLLDRMMPVPTTYKITSRQGQCCVSKGILDEDNLATQGKQISSAQSQIPHHMPTLVLCLRRSWMSILMSHLALSLSLIITWGYKWYLCGHNSIYLLSLITITASSSRTEKSISVIYEEYFLTDFSHVLYSSKKKTSPEILILMIVVKCAISEELIFYVFHYCIYYVENPLQGTVSLFILVIAVFSFSSLSHFLPVVLK